MLGSAFGAESLQFCCRQCLHCRAPAHRGGVQERRHGSLSTCPSSIAVKAPPGLVQLLGLCSAQPRVAALPAWDVSIPRSPPPPQSRRFPTMRCLGSSFLQVPGVTSIHLGQRPRTGCLRRAEPGAFITASHPGAGWGTRVTSRTQESRGQPPCSCRVLRPWGASSAWDRVSPQLRRSSRCTPPPRGCRAPQAPPKGFAAPVPSGAERAEPPAAPTCPHPLGVTAGGRWAVSAVPTSALSCPTVLTPPLRLQGRLPGRVLRSRDLRKCSRAGAGVTSGDPVQAVWG